MKPLKTRIVRASTITAISIHPAIAITSFAACDLASAAAVVLRQSQPE
jgi:hypothetical protein